MQQKHDQLAEKPNSETQDAVDSRDREDLTVEQRQEHVLEILDGNCSSEDAYKLQALLVADKVSAKDFGITLEPDLALYERSIKDLGKIIRHSSNAVGRINYSLSQITQIGEKSIQRYVTQLNQERAQDRKETIAQLRERIREEKGA
jgi:hypothetical protein